MKSEPKGSRRKPAGSGIGMREFTYSEIAQQEATLEAAGSTFVMDEETFRAFYNRTSRALWSYLQHVSGNPTLADDLMQESYYRFLRAHPQAMTEGHAKNYLFRIATNLLRDRWRRDKEGNSLSLAEMEELPASEHTEQTLHAQKEVQGALSQLNLRERQLLWMAYVEGSSHKEISLVAGLRENSIRPLLFRARRKLAGILRKSGLSSSAD
jgi:RNA polymerase sigma-70 factor, ECF subfamily